MATGKETTIELPPLNLEIIEITLVGDTPLISHAWSEKAKRELLDKQLKVAKPAREAKDPNQDFEQSLYRIEGGGYGFPSVAFKAAAVTACTSVAGITKVMARQAFHVVGEQALVRGAFGGALMRTDLVRILGHAPELREDMVRIAMGTADIRYRGQFWPWHAIVSVRFNRNVLSTAQIVNLFNTAGFGVGIGEWRPEKDGQFGMFHVATAEEILRIRAEAA
ncbi:MAG: hypothetical protein H7840_12620 [Alphaproteobacteria bacterium]